MASVKKNKKNSKNTMAALAANLAAGTQTYASKLTAILVDGNAYTTAQAVSELQALVDLRSAVNAAYATYKGKLADERAKSPALTAFVDGYASFIMTAFSGQPEILAAFGLAPKKARQPLTAEQKTAATVKRNATRKARGIVSKKERMAKQGNVTGIIVTPVVSPAASPAKAADPNASPNGAAR